eukprot:g5110.t1
MAATDVTATRGMLAEFDHLLQCYHHADMLARNGLASLKSVKKAMEHLLRLVESAPLVDLQHRVSELQKTGEVVLEATVTRTTFSSLGRTV